MREILHPIPHLASRLHANPSHHCESQSRTSVHPDCIAIRAIFPRLPSPTRWTTVRRPSQQSGSVDPGHQPHHAPTWFGGPPRPVAPFIPTPEPVSSIHRFRILIDSDPPTFPSLRDIREHLHCHDQSSSPSSQPSPRGKRAIDPVWSSFVRSPTNQDPRRLSLRTGSESSSRNSTSQWWKSAGLVSRR